MVQAQRSSKLGEDRHLATEDRPKTDQGSTKDRHGAGGS
jgi:hypothetical protein